MKHRSIRKPTVVEVEVEAADGDMEIRYKDPIQDDSNPEMLFSKTTVSEMEEGMRSEAFLNAPTVNAQDIPKQRGTSYLGQF